MADAPRPPVLSETRPPALSEARPVAGAGRLAGLFTTAARDGTGRLQRAGRNLAQSLRLMVGVPDYETYVDHVRRMHPDREPMSYEAFFRERQQARYGGGSGRCC